VIGCAVLAGLAITFQKSFICINFLSTFLKHMANVARRSLPRKFIGFALAMCAGKARHGSSGKFSSKPAS